SRQQHLCTPKPTEGRPPPGGQEGEYLMELTCAGVRQTPHGRRLGRRPALTRGRGVVVPERRRTMLRTAPRAVAYAFLLGAVFLSAPSVMAGTTGKLHGTVLNEKKEPLVGVNIRVEGQRLGAMTNEKGEFVILGIPAGQ